MKSEAEAMSDVGNAGGVLRETFDIEGRLQRNPYRMVAGAVGIGFVLGGGLFTRLTAKILGAGLRIGLMAALPTLEKQINRTGNPKRVPMPSAHVRHPPPRSPRSASRDGPQRAKLADSPRD